MKIALLVNNFPPEIGSAADLFYQLALEFRKRGHYVEVFTTEPRYYNLGSSKKIYQMIKKKHRCRIWERENMNEIYVYRIKLLPIIYPRSGTIAIFRELEHILQPLTFTAFIYYLTKFDVILIYSPPLILGYIGALIGKFLKIPVVINVQDIHPEAIVDIGLLNNKFLINILELIERQMYNFASAITVHSHGNKEIIIKHGINPHKVFTVYNTCYIPPLELLSRGNIIRQKYSLEGKFIVTYAGIMSFAQDLDTIIKSAKIVSERDKDILFLLVGDGPRKKELVSLSKKLALDNVMFLPFQEGENYWYLLAASDLCLVSLKSTVKTPVVPRKLQDIMAAGRPVVANVPLVGDTAKIINEAQCGIVVEPESPQELAKIILKMKNLSKEEREKMGANGRKYAETHFSPKIIARQYEYIFEKLIEKYEERN
jgi:glycosyltransferase involved in cell wall biosynthesis